MDLNNPLGNTPLNKSSTSKEPLRPRQSMWWPMLRAAVLSFIVGNLIVGVGVYCLRDTPLDAAASNQTAQKNHQTAPHVVTIGGIAMTSVMGAPHDLQVFVAALEPLVAKCFAEAFRFDASLGSVANIQVWISRDSVGIRSVLGAAAEGDIARSPYFAKCIRSTLIPTAMRLDLSVDTADFLENPAQYASKNNPKSVVPSQLETLRIGASYQINTSDEQKSAVWRKDFMQSAASLDEIRALAEP